MQFPPPPFRPTCPSPHSLALTYQVSARMCGPSAATSVCPCSSRPPASWVTEGAGGPAGRGAAEPAGPAGATGARASSTVAGLGYVHASALLGDCRHARLPPEPGAARLADPGAAGPGHAVLCLLQGKAFTATATCKVSCLPGAAFFRTAAAAAVVRLRAGGLGGLEPSCTRTGRPATHSPAGFASWPRARPAEAQPACGGEPGPRGGLNSLAGSRPAGALPHALRGLPTRVAPAGSCRPLELP